MKKNIKYWQKYLGLDDWKFTTVKISRSQVVDEELKRGLSFVGVVPDHNSKHAEIYHTRKMSSKNIVHELLHVKYPNWSEAQVNRKTDQILRTNRKNPWNPFKTAFERPLNRSV